MHTKPIRKYFKKCVHVYERKTMRQEVGGGWGGGREGERERDREPLLPTEHLNLRPSTSLLF